MRRNEEIRAAHAIRVAILRHEEPPWFPSLSALLSSGAWKDVAAFGITPSSYGTVRMFRRRLNAERVVDFFIDGTDDDTGTNCVVESLPAWVAEQYRAGGINLYTSRGPLPSREPTQSFPRRLTEAFKVIGFIPSLSVAVRAFVRSIHLIAPPDPDFDISFSEPDLPFSIFLSISHSEGNVDSIRLAEAIVHEAMHLQLSQIERLAPLVRYTSRSFYSPWKQEIRPASGILHGIYVFEVVNEFLRLILPFAPNKEVTEYIADRSVEIADQRSAINTEALVSSLTPLGIALIRRLATDLKPPPGSRWIQSSP